MMKICLRLGQSDSMREARERPFRSVVCGQLHALCTDGEYTPKRLFEYVPQPSAGATAMPKSQRSRTFGCSKRLM
eukprot:scaffold131632_cov14-Prasinocladus_malaysianus.AAC.1